MTNNLSVKTSSDLANVATSYAFDVKQFQEYSQKFAEQFRASVVELVEKANESWVKSNSNLRAILAEYKVLLSDSSLLANSFILNTRQMKSYLSLWKELIQNQSTNYKDLESWLRDCLKISETNIPKLKEILENEFISHTDHLVNLTQPQMNDLLTKIPLGIRKIFEDQVKILQTSRTNAGNSEFVIKLKKTMSLVLESSDSSKKSLISIGERYAKLIKNVMKEREIASTQAHQDKISAIALGIAAGLVFVTGIFLACSCPLLIPAETSLIIPLAGILGVTIPLAIGLAISSSTLADLSVKLNKTVDVYSKLSQKIQLEENLWSKVREAFDSYIATVDTAHNSANINLVVLRDAIESQSFCKNMEAVDVYLESLILCIQNLQAHLDKYSWEYVQKFLPDSLK